MIETLVSASGAMGAQPLNELLNVAHDRPFSLLFGNYSWLLGMAGGVALVWAIDAVRRERHTDRDPVYQLAMPLCVALIIAGFLNVLAEVQQPSRLIYGYIQGWNYWDTAIIKYGIILLPLFLACSWWLTFQCIDKTSLDRGIRRLPKGLVPFAELFTLWSRHYDVFERPVLRLVVLAAMVVLGLFAALYSAIFLMYEHGVPVWNTPAPALIFLATGLAMGAAVVMVFAPPLYEFATGKQIAPANGELRWLAVAGLTISAITWCGWMWWISRLGTIPDQQFSALIDGPYQSLVLWSWVIIGLVIPLLLLATPLARVPFSRWVAAITVLWGGYTIRIIVVLGGQALNRSGAGYLTFGLEPDVSWYTGFSALFLVGLLALLLLLPYGHSNASGQIPTGDRQ